MNLYNIVSIKYRGYGGRWVGFRWKDLSCRVSNLIVGYISRCIYVKIDMDYTRMYMKIDGDYIRMYVYRDY